MRSSQSKSIRASSLILALFTDSTSLRDAIFDLYQAGFGAGQIRIAASSEGSQTHGQISRPSASRPKPVSAWIPRQVFEHDLQPDGRAANADDGASSMDHQPLYSEMNLEEMLQELGIAAGLGVGEERILLQDREIGPRGTIILLDAGDRSREAQSILEWNRGWVRAKRIPPAA